MRASFRVVLFAAVLGLVAASNTLLPRTMWERRARTDKRRAENLGEKTIPTSTDELREMLKINEGSLSSFSKVAMDLVSKVDFASADPQLFDRMFSTFKILKQSPAYTDAMKSDSGLDMTNMATKSKVLADAVGQLINLGVNLRGGMASVNSKEGGINNKVLEFLKNGDEATLALAEKVKAGDSSAIWDLQQKFMSAEFPGLNLKELPDDGFIKAARALFTKDEGLSGLIGEENTLEVLMDEDLLFGNNPTLQGLI